MIKISTLLFSVLISGAAIAQIPNAGFETWTAHTGYDTPDSWGNINSLTSTASVYTCEKGTTGAPAGSNFLKLTSKTVPILGVAPGIAVTGSITLAGTTPSISGGFPNTSRPASLTGKWQFMASGSDQGRIAIFLSKWNNTTHKRDTVSFTNFALPGMEMMWVDFTIPLTYQKGSTPDTAMIVASASGLTPVANSYLYLDNLAFTGSVPSGVVTIDNQPFETALFPNPAKENTNLYYYSLVSGDLNIEVVDVQGRTTKSVVEHINSGANNISVDLKGLVKGNYFLRLSNGAGSETRKIAVE